MNINRRGFFGRIGAALAGCVLANTPLAGKCFETSPVPEGANSLMMNPLLRQFSTFPLRGYHPSVWIVDDVKDDSPYKDITHIFGTVARDIGRRECEALYA